MKSLVVLAQHPQFANDVRAAVEPLEFRVVHRLSVEEAEPLLRHRLATACLLDLEMAGVQGVWMVESILRRSPDCAVIVFTDDRDPQWEEELYLAGARHVFAKPVRGRLLARTLVRLTGAEPAIVAAEDSPSPAAEGSLMPAPTAPSDLPRAEDQGLLVLRRFSEILTNSLDAAALVRQFLHLLREMVGVNRSAIFLQTSAVLAAGPDRKVAPGWMKAVCAVGLGTGLANQTALSREAGIGGYLLRTGRILRRQDAASDRVARREFELIGAEVAVPIMGRDELLGVAFLDNRVTGQPLTNTELESIFHLLEQIGLALTNIRAHDQVVGSNQLLGDVLRELSNACLVVGPDLTVLQVNKAAQRIIGGAGRRSGTLQFADLPEILGAKLYQVIKTGAALPAFRYEANDAGKSVFNVTVAPIRSSAGLAGAGETCALLVMDDRTQAEQLQQLELETANLKLIHSMADRLAAEIGNAIVPLSLHYQLFDERIKELDFRKTLKTALADSLKRVDRLLSQMRSLYGNAQGEIQVHPLGDLLDDAEQEARRYFSAKPAQLTCKPEVRSVLVVGRRDALKHAFAEIILNGYQSNSEDARVDVRFVDGSRSSGAQEIGIEFEDAGPGFTDEALKRATQPFYTERTVGVGLGLPAAMKIIEGHGGRLQVPADQRGKHGLVRVFLPVKQPQE